MSDYVKSTNFAIKDGLVTTDPAKIVKGTELDNEFNALSNAIASKANTNSPALTGTPTAPTATTGSNTNQLANTAYVAQEITALALGNMSTQAKSAVEITGGTMNGVTGTNSGMTVGTATNAGNASTVTNGVYTTNFTGSNQSLGGSGYQKLPGGLIIQWGQYNSTISDTSPVTVTFPIAFPNLCASMTSNLTFNTPIGGLSAQATYNYILSTSQANVFVGDTGSAGNVGFTWMAIGY